jgi:quercetin dioxygenase-like cupin family protein
MDLGGARIAADPGGRSAAYLRKARTLHQSLTAAVDLGPRRAIPCPDGNGWSPRRPRIGDSNAAWSDVRSTVSHPRPSGRWRVSAILSSMSLDPVVTNPEHYKVVFENDRVRVLEYLDEPGHHTTPHRHPDSVMYTLTSFRRRLVSGGLERDVELSAGSVGWLPAQEHFGENIGDTPTHVLFVELKETVSTGAIEAASDLGPQSS